MPAGGRGEFGPPLWPHSTRPSRGFQRCYQGLQGYSQIVTVQMGGGHVWFGRADGHDLGVFERILEPPAPGQRHPGAHQQAHGAVANGCGGGRMPHGPRERGRGGGDVLRVGNARDMGLQGSAQPLEFGAGVVPGHLLTGHDRHRSGRQCGHDR